MTLPLSGIPGNIQRNYATINFVDNIASEDSFMNMLAVHDHSNTDYANDSMSDEEELDELPLDETVTEDVAKEEQSTMDDGTA
jgi:hypothetical protein